jgi:phosphatidate cytidylyltransferase
VTQFGGPPPAASSDLRTRLASAVVMVAVAVTALVIGGWVFTVLIGIAAALVMHEWASMSGPFRSRVAHRAAVAFVAVAVFASYRDPGTALIGLAAVTAVLAMFSAVDAPMKWLAGGLVYAALPGMAAVMLRGDAPAGVASNGLVAIAFVFVLVWVTDSAAYFAGRRFGGPKLAPSVSPKKTWSGAIGGTVGAVIVGVGAGLLFPAGSPLALGLVALALSVVSQAGDLAESAMKRHFGVKDSGRLIPGHGGIMDRVDGLGPALVLAAGIGFIRGGASDAGAGLLIW